MENGMPTFENQERFVQDIFESLKRGTAISSVQSVMREKGWKNLGGGVNFASLIEQTGFFELVQTFKPGTQITKRTDVKAVEGILA